MNWRGDGARIDVLIHAQWFAHQGVRIEHRIRTLTHGDLAEVFACCACRAHVVRGDEREHCAGPACAVWVGGVAREVAEAAERFAERVDMIRVRRYARHNARVAALHCSRRTTQRHHARCATGRDVIEPSNVHAQMLRHSHGGVRCKRKAADCESVDLRFVEARFFQQSAEGLRRKPMCALGRVANIRHGDRHRDRDAFVGHALVDHRVTPAVSSWHGYRRNSIDPASIARDP